MKNYYFKNNEFIIENYDKVKAFASFLPGIAGQRGIPLWCHYINRCQAIASFGLRDKNGCILEFYPANTAYRIIDKMGFRTFIKAKGKKVEIFLPRNNEFRLMAISKGKIRLVEENKQLGARIEVTYFNLPNECVGGLVRRVSVDFKEDTPYEILDGITQLLPTDANEWMLKHQSNLLKSWMDVKLLNENIAYYYENAIPADTAEVNKSEYGNFYVSFVNDKIVKPIYDVSLLFGYDTTLEVPVNFYKYDSSILLNKKQVSADKVSGGFSIYKSNEKHLEINTLIGYSPNEEFIINLTKKLSSNYFINKEKEADEVIEELTKDVETHTSYPLFDAYMEQNYLDNILRGGYPITIKADNKKFIYHLFSRRHGDMEREYNFYSLSPEYYSQGNGNFRDVCQNRRSDSLFKKDVEILNAYQFASLIQLDGYNPLGIEGITYRIGDEKEIEKLTNEVFSGNQKIKEVLSSKFTPGLIVNTMEKEHVTSTLTDMEIFERVFKKAHQEINSTFGEGYWVDHWTYILDLVENAIKIYPERVNDYLYKDTSYKFYSSPVTVLPRDEKYCINHRGDVRQYGALLDKDEEKIAKCNMNIYTSNWVKDELGNEITTNLFGKLYTLVINKFASLDPARIGISMEANKPGWNDAMNGLPGLFSSGVSETIELARVVEFLINNLTSETTMLPKELVQLNKEILAIYNKDINDFDTWDEVTTALEKFRSDTRFNVSKQEVVDVLSLKQTLELIKKTLDIAIEKAKALGNGIIPTFITYKATKYEKLNKIGHYGFDAVKVTEFIPVLIPHFLEAPARSMKYLKDITVLKNQYNLIKQTTLYDKELKVYKTSCDLDDTTYEVGRVRAFQKGWLERESDFLHMTYKYLLGLLKAKMYKEFYKEIKTNFVCFMDPAIYGRSTLENSSFIATSNNPDKEVHGQGFVARLSGSTAEMLSMWNEMFFGDEPFKLVNNEVLLNIKPNLTKDFFKDGIVKVRFLTDTLVTYVNESNVDTFKLKPTKYIFDGIEQPLTTDLSKKVRNGEIKDLVIYLN